MRKRKISGLPLKGSEGSPQKRSPRVADRIVQRFLPDSYVRLAWDGFIFSVIWYNSVITPIRIFIMSGDTTPQVLISLDVVFDFIFVADTILRFYRPYVDENTGLIVTDPHLIRVKYRGSLTFIINAVACIPIIKLPISPFLSSAQQAIMLTYFNVLRMIRVLHLPGQFQELKRFRERKEPVNEPVFRMYIILFFMLLFMCQCGCLYFGLSTLLVVDDICPPPENFVDDILGEEMWVAEDTVITDVMDTRVCEAEPSIQCDDCPLTMFFTRSIYFLMQTIFTIGYGDTVVPSKSSVEMALACAFMIFGVFAYALTIANMTSVLANLDVVNMQFRHEMDTISRWLTLRSVPAQLRHRLTTYFSYLSRTQYGMLDEVLLGELPPRLSSELAELHVDLLTRVPFFKKERRSEAFLSMIAAVLKRRIFTPGSFILYQGEMQRELIIIKKGKAEIRVAGVTDAVGNLIPGDFIGDYQLLFGTANQVGLQTSDFTETLALTFGGLTQVMSHSQNEHFSFASMGYTFRQSDDEGCIETIQATKQSLKKIMSTATTVLGGKGRSKLKNMMREDTIRQREFRISPNSRVHLCWDITSMCAILYYAIRSPVRIASYVRSTTLSSGYDSSFILDYCIDLMFIVDMILRSTIYSYDTYQNGQTVVVSDSSSIRHKYLSSKKFKIDLLAVLPFDFISLGTGSYHVVYRLSKLVRVIQLPSAISSLQKHLDLCFDVKMNETQRSVLLMLVYSLLLVVWSSAGWNALRPDESAIVSVYWAITTLSTVGYGDVTPVDFTETFYALIVGAVGAVFTAAVVANVTSFFHDAELSENNYEHKLNCIKRYMDRHKIPNELCQKVIEYFDYVEQEQDGLNEAVLLRDAIPDHLSTNLLVHITQSMVGNCDFFADCESGFIRKIMVSMEQAFYGAEYMVLTADVPSDSMYFIKKGRVDLMLENADNSLKVIRKLHANDSFAEGCLVENWTKNPILARTARESELWILRRSVFRKIIREFPRSRSMLRQIATNTEDTRRRASVHHALRAAEMAKRNTALYLEPHSYFMQAWFGLILGVTLYSMIAVPFRVAFLENYDISIPWMLFDYLGDLMFLVDFIFRAAYLAFYDENNNLIVGHRQIWERYLKSGKVKWHVLCALPLEAIVVVVPSLCPLWKLQTWYDIHRSNQFNFACADCLSCDRSLFRLNKLLRAIEMPYLIKRVESSLAKAGVKVPKNPLKVTKLLLVILLLAHLNSCVFFAIANFNQHANSGDVDGQTNWASSEGLIEPSPQCPGVPVPLEIVSQQYTAGLYWAMATISTAGYGDITGDLNSVQEILYSTLILIVGMMVYTLVIASLEDIVSQLDVTSSLHKMKTDRVNTFAQIQCLPEHLKAKIGAYQEQLWRSHFGVKGEQLMQYVPPFLKSDLISGTTEPFLDKTFFLKDCAADVVAHVVRVLDLEIYLPGDCLFREGERCDLLYFVHSGAIDLLTAQNVKFKTVSHCTLGESSFFMFEPHICTARTVDSCEIYQLRMDAFLRILHDNQLRSKFEEYLSLHQQTLQEAKASIEKTIQNLSSSKMVRFLDANEGIIKVSKGIILPDSQFRVAWDVLAFLSLVYLILSIPMTMSFARKSVNPATFLVDLMVDAFFIGDIYCRLRKFAIVKDGFLVSTPKTFAEVYRKDEFGLDLISALPLSFFVFVTGAPADLYGLFRLVQLLRAARFDKYLEGLVEILNTRSRFVVTTATLRVCQIFMIILFSCHWFSCIFHLVGSQGETESWIIADDMEAELTGRRYLRSFYWSLYTITTIGYGSVPIVTIRERVLAMVAMAVGAVICDAGLTAVLASILANKDHQAGTNNRRIQCSKLFMTTNSVEEQLQARILEYYAFADNELKNIDENIILDGLSSSLKSEILSHFCFEPLRECAYFDEYSVGAVYSLIKLLKPYIAVPGECLSEIGKECHSLYVFQKGSVRTKDATGSVANVAEGAVIGHLATLATSKKEGLPTHELQLDLISANLTRSKSVNSYVIVGNERSRCRSLIKNSRNWMEKIAMKVKVGRGKKHKTEIIVKEWRKRQIHATIGSGQILVSQSSPSDPTICSIFDDKGRNAGSIQLRATLAALSEADQLSSHELTSTALSFSQLYQLEVSDDRLMARYFLKSKMPNPVDRIPIEADQALQESDLENEEHGGSSNDEFDWDNPVQLQSIPTTQSNMDDEGKRRSVFFVEWADKPCKDS
ncbi:hypothetical protein ACHAWF_016401 [Thalassiosira exigua]